MQLGLIGWVKPLSLTGLHVTLGPLSSMVICMFPSVSSCDCKLCSVGSTWIKNRLWPGIVDSSEHLLSALPLPAHQEDTAMFCILPWLPLR